MDGYLDIGLARNCLLMERVSLAFDSIPMCSPVDRVKAVAKGITEACKENEALRLRVQEAGYMNQLKAAAQFRMNGEVRFPAALKASFDVPGPSQRESIGV